MVEHVIGICAQLEGNPLRNFERLVQAEVHTISAGSDERVTFGILRITEQRGASGGQVEGIDIPLLRLARALLHIADDLCAKAAAEVTHRIDGSGSDVAGEYRVAVIAIVEGRESGAGLGKHIEGCLPSADGAVEPAIHIATEALTTAHGKINDPVGHHPMS